MILARMWVFNGVLMTFHKILVQKSTDFTVLLEWL